MQFNHNLEIYNTKAAEIVVPIIIEKYKPNSVLDIGCGIGTWLSVFKDKGVKTIFGVDGEWVDRSLLRKFIDEGNFLNFDLRNELCLEKKFDIVMSLEVAEHIEEKYADNFVKSLVNHGEIIVFSAAIPFQGGENHVNEQWPTYWIEKFKKFEYFPNDGIRPLIWNNRDIEFWYKQNILVFSKEEREREREILNIIHPELYLSKIQQFNGFMNNIERGNFSLKYYINLKLSKYYSIFKSYLKNDKN